MVTKMEKNSRYPNLGLIAAIGQNRELGFQNDLIWKIKEDMSFFKKVTMNSFIIMGRKTYESLPKNLVGRSYIILSRNKDFVVDQSKVICNDIDTTLSLVSKNFNTPFWVIGGGKIYELFLPYVDVMHLTKIQDQFSQADAYFPEFDYSLWSEDIGSTLYSEDNIPYQHVYLKRK